MSLFIFAIIVLIVAALFVAAVERIDVLAPFGRLIQALIIIVAALVILNRAGLV